MGGRGEPRFLWTGLLILGPVVALGAVGFWQLRQDRAGALAEAREQAVIHAERVARSGRQFLTSAGWEISEQLSPEGLPLARMPYSDPPEPPLNPSPDVDALATIEANPDQSLAEKSAAASALAARVEGHSQAGIPMRMLALHSALRWGEEATFEPEQLEILAGALAESAVLEPSVFSQRMLEEAARFLPESSRSKWQQKWRNDERFRQFYRQHQAVVQSMVRDHRAGRHLHPSGILLNWLPGGEGEVELLCRLRGDELEGFLVDLLPVTEIEVLIGERTGWPPEMPHHLGARLSLDGREIASERTGTGGDILAVRDIPQLAVRAEVLLADADLLLAPVAKHTRRTALLIALAALAAAVGWFAAWRAFRRQRQLAAMKDDFVSAVSHELKAPVASIGLMAEEMGRGAAADEGKRKEYAALIAGECARLGSLVENVLDYARIESGREGFDMEEADVAQLVRAYSDLMRPAAAARGMGIEVDAPPAGELCAEIDARAVGRALVNLIDNAIKYAPPETPISVAAERLGAAGVRIAVTDRGEPVPAEERGQIFDKFYRSGSELTRETEGVGIGLSLVRHIALAHGGRVALESGPAGNRFVFETDGKA